MKNLLGYLALGTVAVGTVAFVASRPASAPQTVPAAPIETSSQMETRAAPENPPVTKTEEPKSSSVAGNYRCFSYNVSGSGGECRTVPPIILNEDGTYDVSSEHGTYSVSGAAIVLSESKLRGPGTIIDGNKIRFEYDYRGLHHVVTYLREGAPAQKPAQAAPSGDGSPIAVTLNVIYPPGTSGLSGISSIDLKSHDPNDATKYEALAFLSDDHTVQAIFGIKKGVRTGASYDVYAGSGTSEKNVGTFDLSEATGEQVTESIYASVGQ